MSNETTYSVRVRYTADDRAAPVVSGLKAGTQQLGAAARSTSGDLLRMGAAVVSAFGARAAGSALIGFNATVQDTRLQIAGMLALTKKTDLSAQVGVADRLYSSLQKRAASLPGTTAEYAQMLGMLTQPISAAGGGLRDLEDMTVNATVAAKALGVSWDVAARDIDQALRGQFHSVDQFTGKILGSMGFTGEEGRAKFNAMSSEKRFSTLSSAIMQKQIGQLSEVQGQSFRGVLSTLQDTLEQTMGKVGLPLFERITREIKAWNAWTDQNGRRIAEVARSVGDGLVTGFNAVKSAVMLIVDHADTIMAIGKIWLATKVGGLVSGAVAAGGGATVAARGAFGAGGFFRGMTDRFNPETGAYESTGPGRGRQAVTMRNIGGNLPLLAQSAAVGVALGTLIDKSTGLSHALSTLALDKTSLEFERVNKSADALALSLQRAADANPKQTAAMTNLIGARENLQQQANVVLDMMRAQQALSTSPFDKDARERYVRARKGMNDLGIDDSDLQRYGGAQGFASAMLSRAGALQGQQNVLGGAGAIAWEIGIRQLTEYQRQTLDEARAQQDVMSYINQQLSKGLPIAPASIMDLLRRDTDDPTGKHRSLAEKPKVTVHINRIEVQSDDPDRMAFGLVEAFRDAAKNPSSALAALREG